MKKLKIGNIKVKAEKIIVIAKEGSGFGTLLCSVLKNLPEKYIRYQSIHEMLNNEDSFSNYDCIVLYSPVDIEEMDYIKEFVLSNITDKDRKNAALNYYIPQLSFGVTNDNFIVYSRIKHGYKAYADRKRINVFVLGSSCTAKTNPYSCIS